VKAPKAKARKHDHSWASAEILPGEERRYLVYHFEIVDDQYFLKDNFTLRKYLF